MKPKITMIRVYANNAHQGQPFSSLSLPPGCHGLSIIRENQLLTLSDHPVIQEGDWLIAVAVNGAWGVELDVILKQPQANH